MADMKEAVYEAMINGQRINDIGIEVKTWISYNDVREDLRRHFGDVLPCPAKVTKFKDGSYSVERGA